MAFSSKLSYYLMSIEGIQYEVDFHQCKLYICNETPKAPELYQVRISLPNVDTFGFFISDYEFNRIYNFLHKFQETIEEYGVLINSRWGYIDYVANKIVLDEEDEAVKNETDEQTSLKTMFDWYGVENENLPEFEPIFIPSTKTHKSPKFFQAPARTYTINKTEFKKRMKG